MGKHAHFFESRRDTLAPHASNAQGGPLCKRGGCVRTLRTPPAYGLEAHYTFKLLFAYGPMTGQGLGVG